MPKEKAPTKRRGRPPKAPEEVKRVPLSLRTTPEFRKKFENAATKSGRSIAQEVEQRLERSFFFEDTLSLSGADNKTAQFTRDILDSKRLVEVMTEGDAWTDYEVWLSWRAAILELLDQRAPSREDFDAREEECGHLREEWLEHGYRPMSTDVPPYPRSHVEMAATIGQTLADALATNRIKSIHDTLAKVKERHDQIMLEQALAQQGKTSEK